MSDSLNEDIDGFNIFEVAKKKECSSLFKMVLDNLAIYNFDIENQDEDGNTLLHLVIRHQEQDSIVEQVIAMGSNVNSVNNIGETPLQLACKRGGLKLVKILVEKGADIHIQDTKGKSLLHLVVEKNNLELCKFLIDRGVDVNSQDHNGSTPLHCAIEQKLSKITFLLVHKADINKQDSDGYAPLHVASRTSNELVRFLLRNKASPDSKTLNGDSPLHLAASSGNLEAVIVLLNGEIKANTSNNDNYTPVKLAEINGHEKVRRLLLRNSTNPSAPSSKIPKAARFRKLNGNANSGYARLSVAKSCTAISF